MEEHHNSRAGLVRPWSVMMIKVPNDDDDDDDDNNNNNNNNNNT
jgi:hypothetical protein